MSEKTQQFLIAAVVITAAMQVATVALVVGHFCGG